MSARPFWRTWVAAAVLAGLGGYIYFVESKRETEPAKPKEKVFTLDKAKVKELTLASASGEPIHLVKQGSNWRMTAPRDVPADGGEVDSLLASLENLDVDEVVAEGGARLADFGLAEPQQTVSVLLEGASEPLKLLIGDKTPDGGGLYAKLPSRSRVFTVASYMAGSFDKKPFDLRDRSVLHVKRDAVQTLEITGPEGSYALARSGKDQWTFTRPLPTRAGRWEVDGLLGSLENLRMDSVAAEEAKDLKPFGLDKPARRVVLGLDGGATKTLEIGRATPDKKYDARDAGSRLVAVIPPALVDDLAKGMDALRAKRLLEVAAYEVEGVDVEAGGTKRVYARSATKDAKEGFDVYKWKRTSPDAKEIDTNKVQDALFKVGGVEVQAFVDVPDPPSVYGLDKPALKATFRMAGGKPGGWFEVGQKTGGVRYALRSDDAAVLKLDAAKAEELIKAFEDL